MGYNLYKSILRFLFFVFFTAVSFVVVDLLKTVKKWSPLRSTHAFVEQVLNVLSLKRDEVFKCQAETCTLFVPEEKYTDLMLGYETKVKKIFKPNNFPLCCCNEAASLWLSHSISNPDRLYFRCQDTDVDGGKESKEEKAEEKRTDFYCKYEATA